MIKTDILSRRNPRVLFASSLADKKSRDASGMFRFEGITLLRELYDRGRRAAEIFVTNPFLEKNRGFFEEVSEKSPETAIYAVTDEVYGKLTNQSSPEGVLCVCEKSQITGVTSSCASPLPLSGGVIICEGLRDPGNLGTVIRAAAAFGTDAVFCCRCADVFSEKTVRGAMGALFDPRVVVLPDISAAVGLAKAQGYRVIAAALHKNAAYLAKGSLTGKEAIIIGSEGPGVSDEALALSDDMIAVKTRMESLNAAQAATLFMYEMSRS